MKLDFAPLSSNAEWAELSKLLEERRTERTTLRHECEEILGRIRARQEQPHPSDVEGERIATVALGKPFATKLADDTQLAELNKRISELNMAIDFLMAKMSGVANIHAAAVCESMRKQHNSIASELFAAVVAANDATLRYKEFLDTLTAAGINVWHFPQDIMPNFLEAGQKHGRMACWLDTVANAGVVSRSKIPNGLDFRK